MSKSVIKLKWKISEPTSKISLLAFGDVASLKTLMATGIFTSSPSGTHRPCRKTGVLFYIF